ncbi:hypothetical protein [Flagellimonas pacifica]|uniref:Fibronectin type-III domain-containing protein n=1 Tax=Flagellimonas pacifica TaxID=1247520 RepID=A0A285MRA7_9FLAO|nr:hypothetical protein [Allomuricauda parva]SNY99695.1 hypothetical protein SAMN06265377_1506 [Allomuricauda parva]
MMNKFKTLFTVIFTISYGCEDILEVPDISNQTVTMYAPLNETVVNDNDVNFNWDKVEDATSYRFQLAAPDFDATQQMVLDSIFEVDSLNRVSTQIKQTLINGNYAWRIKAMNSDYQTVYTLSGFQVNGDENLDLIPPKTPQLVAPANGASQSEATVDFSWTREDVPGTAERDSIFVYTDESLQTLSTKALGANKTYSVNLASGTFYWVVRAYDLAGNKSDISTTFNFTISN